MYNVVVVVIVVEINFNSIQKKLNVESNLRVSLMGRQDLRLSSLALLLLLTTKQLAIIVMWVGN